MTAPPPAPIGFAHRGSPAVGVRENTLTAFRAALACGVRALESDVWVTADGVPVLEHDGVIWHRGWRRPIRTLRAAELPSWLPTLPALYEEIGGEVDLSLDLKDAGAAAPVLAAAAAVGGTRRLWLCATIPVLAEVRRLSPDVRLANSTTLRGESAERLADRLTELGIDAVNLRAPEWTPVRARMFADRQVLAFAWDVQRLSLAERLLREGCDALYSDSCELLLRVTGAH